MKAARKVPAVVAEKRLKAKKSNGL